MSRAGDLPLRGVTVIDTSRMLPGAVLARTLLDLGARLIKIEAPGTGDPMRILPPLIGGVGAGFCAFFRGAESVGIDLGSAEGPAKLHRLVGHADVLIESFRSGRLASWGLDPVKLLAEQPALIVCSLPSYSDAGGATGRVGHDLNFIAESGLLSCLAGDGIPRVQIADVTAALLACSALLAALLDRERCGRGRHIVQPLASGPPPHLTWALAEAAAGATHTTAEVLLAGLCPAYRLYRCGDGLSIALGAVEPKFWASFVDALDLGELAGAGLDRGPAGAAAARRVEERLATRPREHWLKIAARLGLPVTAVNDLAAAARRAQEPMESTPVPGGGSLATPGPYLASVGRAPDRPAPRLDEHGAAVFEEFGIG